MKKTVISVTEAARNFAECVNRARYQNTTFILVKNGTPVARLAPEPKKSSKGRDLAAALARTRLTAEEAAAWHRDLRVARQKIKPPVDKWR